MKLKEDYIIKIFGLELNMQLKSLLSELSILKDLPLWLIAGIAIAIDIVLFLPLSKHGISFEVPWWFVFCCVLSNTLAITKSISIYNNRRKYNLSRQTFHLSPVDEHCFWTAAKQKDGSIVIQLSAELMVKNCSNEPVFLVSTCLKKPYIRGKIINSIISVRAVNKNIYGTANTSGYLIPAGFTLPAHVHILIQGNIGKKTDKTLKATLIVTDSGRNQQKVQVLFKGIEQHKAQEKKVSLEALFTINDPLEKNVVSVLQSELARYNKCGWTVGGLGSIQLTYQGRTMVGVGTEFWEANSPKNQSIVKNPEDTTLQSDNLNALLVLYKKLKSEVEQKQFINVLINRLDGKKGYQGVSYFIVCILWKIGHLHDALHKAKISLPQNETEVFALSNILKMLNGLLRYCHNDFTDKMLDDIEEFISGMDEHMFLIPEKIASIRTMRLNLIHEAQSLVEKM